MSKSQGMKQNCSPPIKSANSTILHGGNLGRLGIVQVLQGSGEILEMVIDLLTVGVGCILVPAIVGGSLANGGLVEQGKISEIEQGVTEASP